MLYIDHENNRLARNYSKNYKSFPQDKNLFSFYIHMGLFVILMAYQPLWAKSCKKHDLKPYNNVQIIGIW